MKNNKLTLKDIIDTKSFEQTLEYDVLQIMSNWNKETNNKVVNNFVKEKEEETKIEKIVRKVIKEEINKMTTGQGLLGEKFLKKLEYQGFVRNCPTCMLHLDKK